MTAFPLLSDERIDAIANQMPNGIDGFLKGWGWRQFAEAIESESRAPLLAEIERLTREQSNTQARLDRAILAAEEHFGEDAVRYKLSLSKNGRPRNCFPSDMDGKWFAFQRADDDAHVGLSLRCLEVEIERDELRAEVERLKAENHNLNWALGSDGYDQMATPEEQAEADAYHARVIENIERMKARAERHRRLVPEGEDVLDVVDRLKASEDHLLKWLCDLRFALKDYKVLPMPEFVEYAASLKADAERYRWLAGQHWVEPEAVFRLALSDTEDAAEYMQELSVAIDAARAQGGE